MNNYFVRCKRAEQIVEKLHLGFALPNPMQPVLRARALQSDFRHSSEFYRRSSTLLRIPLAAKCAIQHSSNSQADCWLASTLPRDRVSDCLRTSFGQQHASSLPAPATSALPPAMNGLSLSSVSFKAHLETARLQRRLSKLLSRNRALLVKALPTAGKG